MNVDLSRAFAQVVGAAGGYVEAGTAFTRSVEALWAPRLPSTGGASWVNRAMGRRPSPSPLEVLEDPRGLRGQIEAAGQPDVEHAVQSLGAVRGTVGELAVAEQRLDEAVSQARLGIEQLRLDPASTQAAVARLERFVPDVSVTKPSSVRTSTGITHKMWKSEYEFGRYKHELFAYPQLSPGEFIERWATRVDDALQGKPGASSTPPPPREAYGLSRGPGTGLARLHAGFTPSAAKGRLLDKELDDAFELVERSRGRWPGIVRPVADGVRATTDRLDELIGRENLVAVANDLRDFDDRLAGVRSLLQSSTDEAAEAVALSRTTSDETLASGFGRMLGS